MTKGKKSLLETGYVYAPYIMVEREPVMYLHPVLEAQLFLIRGI